MRAFAALWFKPTMSNQPSSRDPAAAIIALEDRHSSGVYPKRGLAIARGEGATLWDADGRAYIDCVGGQGAANLGHANPAIVAAIQAQAAELISCPEIFHNQQRARYLEALAAVLPPDLSRLFLCNSGTEAIEGCFKFARMLSGRSNIVAAVRGFHGRSMGALSATWEPKYRAPFQPLLPGVTHVPFNRIEQLRAAVDDQTAAVVLEPVQGEGGVYPASPAYLAQAAELCRERGALLIVDEIQTGFGRTGTLWASEQYGVVPDLMALAKSIAGGLPMGAIAIHERFGVLPSGAHGSTFGGNPLACAAALAALRFLQSHNLPQQAAEKGVYLREQLNALPSDKIREVRGLGLLIGIELRERSTPYLQALAAQGVLALPAGPNVIRLLPPLVISYAQLDAVVAAIGRVLA